MILVKSAITEAMRAGRHILAFVSRDRALRTYVQLVLVSLTVVLAAGVYAATGAPYHLAMRWDLGRDRGWPEIYGYFLSASAAGFLLATWWRTRILAYLAFGAVFAFVLIDDAFKYHEGFGRHVLRPHLDLPQFPGARTQDTAELLAWAIAGLLLSIPLGLALLQKARGKIGILAILAVPFGIVVAFGIGGDMLHSIIDRPRLKNLAGIVEDGGESVGLAVASCLAFALWRCPYGAVRSRSMPHDPLRRASRRPDLHAKP